MTAWAILTGGVIQEASVGLVYADLDWMEGGHVADREEAEASHEALTAAVHSGMKNWADDLAEVVEMLVTFYNDNDIPENERVWSR